MNTVPSEASRPLQYGVAIRRSDLPSGVRATCWALATFANNKSGKAWPTVKTLAKAAGLSEAVVSKHTARAEAAGYLHKERHYNGSIVYTITTPVTHEMITTGDAGTLPDVPTPVEGAVAMDEHGKRLEGRLSPPSVVAVGTSINGAP